MTNGQAVEFVIEGTTLDGKPFRPNGVRFLVNFAKDNELLAEMQRVADTA